MDLQYAFAWGIFLLFVLGILAVDLFVFHRKPHVINLREALLGAALPVVLALLFIIAIFFAYQNHTFDLGILPAHLSPDLRHFYPSTGKDASILYLTGYIVELSLSADNVFLFVILMNFFKVPRALQHRVLFWGVLGALVMRGIMIGAGAALLSRFEWIIYLFGAFLLFTAAKMLFSSDDSHDPSDNLGARLARKLFPLHNGFVGKAFFTKIDGKTVATTLFLVLICIEFTDLVFALDSIPAIFGITRDPFIVFTSNVFAILGLRSMYFLLAGIMDKFRFLKTGLALVLAFVGIKMVLPGLGELYGHFVSHSDQHWEIDQYLSLAIILGTLTTSILASLLIPAKTHTRNPLDTPDEPPDTDRALSQ